MSQRTRKTRQKTLQNTSNSPKKEDSVLAKYFKDCSTFISEEKINSKNRLSKVTEQPEDEVDKPNSCSRIIGAKTKISAIHSLVPLKRYKNIRSNNGIHSRDNSKNYDISPPCSSVQKLHMTTQSSKNKSDIFNNITENFSSSKILSLNAVSNITSQKRLELSSWGLPSLILEKYQQRGIKTMFPWQVECLANQAILEENKNLVYSAPTSAGKTLVAEFLVFKTVLERRKKVIFILPFVSVVREKMFYFQDLLSDSGIRVEGFMGGIAPPGGFAAVHVAIATIEKANSLINRLMEDGNLVTLGAVVIDELHLLGDPGRGYLLELLLTKLRYMTLNSENINIQLIGMSATLPNLPLIAEWLDAELYKTDFRPIPLKEQCKIGSSLFDTKFNLIRELAPASDIINDTDNIIQLCIETIVGAHGVLIFCPAKNWCEKLATQIASAFYQLGRDNTPHGQILRKNIDLTAVQEVLIQLEHSPVGLDSVLKKTVSFGVAFHHAGLTMDERDIIEGAFRVGSLKVLVATSTLSSGVNLPARRVIIRSPIFNGRPLNKLTYHQMIGRAGRMGKDTAGESILICRPNERPSAVNLMTSSLEPIESCLEDSGPLIRALLEAIASEVVRTPIDLEIYSKCTFVSKCENNEVTDMVQEAVEFLVKNEFLLLKNVDGKEQRIVATCLGKACLAASIPPRDGLFLFEELQRARKCLVLDTELHVVYLVTPFNSSSQIATVDWMVFVELWRSLSESERRVGQLVGVEERYLMNAMRGVVKPGKILNVHRRFYTAMALHDLVREVSLNAVCRKYNCCRGMLQSLQQSSSTFSGMVTNFCKELKWDCMELLFSQFQARLQFGVCRDLLDLLRLPSLNGLRARSLFKHRITTVSELAMASEYEVEEALNKALPFESEKDFDGGNEAEVAKRTKMRTVFITGKDGLTAREAAVIVIKEARVLVKNELGVRDVQWSQASNNDNQSNPTSPTDDAISLRPLSITGELPASRSPSIEMCVSVDEKNHTRSNEKRTSVVEQADSPIEEKLQTRVSKVAENLSSQDIMDSSDKTEVNEKLSEHMLVETPKNCNENLVNSSNNEETPTRNRLSTNSATDGPPVESQDVINKSDEHEPSSRNLRSKLAEKTKSLLKEDNFTIRSIDFLSNEMDSPKQQTPTNLNTNQKVLEMNEEKAKSQTPESFQMNSRVLDEILKVTEKRDENVFQIPAPVAKSEEEEKKRVSSGSNYSKSPSLFSDSSFFDGQICSVLEKNLIDSADMAEFEKENFTLQNEFGKNVSSSRRVTRSGSIDISKIPQTLKESTPINTPVCEQLDKNRVPSSAPKSKNIVDGPKTTPPSSLPMTWIEDSWDKSKNILPTKKENVKSEKVKTMSPSLLGTSKIRTHTNPSTRELTLDRMIASSSKENKFESPRNTTPKPILHKRIFDNGDLNRSPVAGIKTYNTRRPILPSTPSSNKSDSEDSILSSQAIDGRQAKANKTRTRIQQKVLVTTQRLRKSAKVRDEVPKVVDEAVVKLVNQNDEPQFDGSSSSDNDSTDSCLMFDSDDTYKSRASKESRKRKESISSIGNMKLIRADSYSSIKIDGERIKPSAVEPINVALSKKNFRLFRDQIEGTTANQGKTCIAVSLVTELCKKKIETIIGNRVIGIEEKKKTKKNDNYVYGDKRLCGVVFSWGVDAIYYMPFSNAPETKVTIKERLNFLRNILTNSSVGLWCFNAKEVYKMFYVCCEIESCCKFLDPRTGDWMMNTEISYKSYDEMAAQYFPRGLDIANLCESNFGAPILTGTTRAGAKALLSWYITKAIIHEMKERNNTLLSAYEDIEMPTTIALANMELRGFSINMDSLLELSAAMKNDISRIEELAYGLAGRKFNFYSSREVAQVLGVKKGRGATNKTALKSCENPIANLITMWRKLSTVQSKVIIPLISLEKKNNRVFGSCITHTVTGRVSMHEPNLQTIPRDFNSDISGCVFSVRTAFVPSPGNVMLSADFCQLELRILAHFSQDPILCKLMHEQGDIFRNIAARLNKTSENQVNDDMRQRAKQLCYAMIYGMGTKALAETLCVTESEAKDYLEGFMGTYKGIRVWLNAVVEQARKEGFVSTLTGRRRVLPGINSKTPAVKAQAERQAVNTKVQGSAADIAKKAMVLIESKLQEEFSNLPVTFPVSQTRRKLRSSDGDSKPRGGYLILQLHDELIYEVNSNDLQAVVNIVKESMEHAFELSVPLPVKMKIGSAWGILEEYKI